MATETKTPIAVAAADERPETQTIDKHILARGVSGVNVARAVTRVKELYERTDAPTIDEWAWVFEGWGPEELLRLAEDVEKAVSRG